MFILLNTVSVVMARWRSVEEIVLAERVQYVELAAGEQGTDDLKDGFSVVAPMSVTMPFSTAPRSESCCDLEKRWISSIKRIGDAVLKKLLSLAFWITSLTSASSARHGREGVERHFQLVGNDMRQCCLTHSRWSPEDK